MPTAEKVNSVVKYAPVHCSNCKRYAGEFVGKGQCRSCGKWLVVDNRS